MVSRLFFILVSYARFRGLALFVVLGVALLGVSAPAGAAVTAYPGFRTLGIWSDEDNMRLDVCVWYPVQRAPSAVRYGDWVLKVNRSAKPMEGRFPLIIISHSSAGSRFAHHDLAAELSSQGFIVAAPTHQGDNTQNMPHLFTSRQLTQRLQEIRHTIDKVCADPELGLSVDSNRIGVLGFGAGGSAALLAVGARVSKDAWESWKASAPADAPYMYGWTRQRLDVLVEDPALHRIQADSRIRAVAVVAPTHAMFFDAASLSRVRVPVLLVAGERDPINPLPRYLEKLRDDLPSPPKMVRIANAGPLSFMAQPEGRHAETMPGYAAPTPREQAAIVDALRRETTAFFMDTVGNPHLPPPPAVEEEPAPKAPEPAPQQTSKKPKKRR